MDNLNEREAYFRMIIAQEGQEYDVKMREQFFSYWSEPNKKNKMRWELEKTWDLKRRLKRWFDNQNKWNATRNNNSLPEQNRNKAGTSEARVGVAKAF